MEKIIEDLRQILSFKGTTDIGDIIIVASKKPQMLLYGLVTSIERDESRKDEWWVLGFTLLSFPPQNLSWTLRLPQMTGMEIFTMGGEEKFIGPLELVESKLAKKPEGEKRQQLQKKGTIKRIK